MHYSLRLFDFYERKTRQETSIDELAQIWQCSTRYAKTIVKGLQQQQIIQWETSRGRGKRPFMTLLQSKEFCVLQVFKTYWQKQHFEEAYAIASEYQMMQHPMIQTWIEQQYGLKNKEYQHILYVPYARTYLELDPMQANSNWDAHLIKQIHEPLFKENATSGEIETNLLFAYETIDNQKWRFILRKSLYFHDLTPVKASDVQYSLERLTKFSTPYFSYKKIEKINDYELVVELSTPFAIFPELLATFRAVILPQSTPNGTIGCGAFKLENATPYKIQLRAFEQYFDKRPFIDGVDLLADYSNTPFFVSEKPFAKDILQREIVMNEVGIDYAVLNQNKKYLQDEKNRVQLLQLLDGKANVDLKELPKFFKIGYQYVSEQENYLEQAQHIQQKLTDYGIQIVLYKVAILENISIDMELDVFLGGATFGKQKILSILNLYFTKPQAIWYFQNEVGREKTRMRLEKLYAERNFSLDEEIMALQEAYFIKVLKRHAKKIYIQDGKAFKNLTLDQHGFINYHKAFI